jgi:ubiquinone/menaquinone biosynthesis C-methylase UbiE
LILDVGCSDHPRGDVNVDVDYTSDADVLADACYLPFRNDVFMLVRSNHCLEHTANPCKMLDEMLRVSNGKVLIVVPHRYSRLARRPVHCCFFNASWFSRFAKSRRIASYVQCTFGLLSRPVEIVAELWK